MLAGLILAVLALDAYGSDARSVAHPASPPAVSSSRPPLPVSSTTGGASPSSTGAAALPSSTTAAVSGGVIPPLPAMGRLVPPGADTRAVETSASGARRGVAVFGDSLVLQSWTYLHRIAAARDQPFDGGAYGGTAICDWMPSIEKVLRVEKPAYLVLAFAGNNLTPCTLAAGGARQYGASLVALYRRATQHAITLARAQGTKVFVVGPPAMQDAVWNDDALGLRVAMRDLATTNPHVGYLDADVLLSPDGFRAARPCLAFETPALGCAGGSIVVRASDGVHLDPPVGGDRGYSAGGWRYATLLMRGIPNAS